MGLNTYRDKVFELVKFTPTKGQEMILSSPARIKLVAGGERGGKSVVGSKEALLAMPLSKLIWLVSSEYDVSRTEFNYLMEDLQKIKQIITFSTSKEGSLTGTAPNGCQIVTKSAQDYQKLGMEAPDFILVCEAAQIEYEAYLRLRGRIAEKRGKMVLTGTFEGSVGWYADMFTRWQGANDEDAKSYSLPSWDNPVVYPGGRNDPEILRLEAQTPKDIFMERYAGVPCKPSGLIVSEFTNALHVGEYPLDPEFPVELAVDPGYAGAHVVEVCQWKSDELYIIDEIYLQGYVTEDIITICKQKPWWGYVKGGSIDIAGKQHQAMQAPIEVWQNHGLNLTCQKVEVSGGIDLLRTFMKVNPLNNRVKLHADYKCKGFISECGGGKSPLYGGGPWLRDMNTGKEIDKNNHACKSIIYLLVNRFGYSPYVKPVKYEPIKSLTFAGQRSSKWWKK
jgi:hypothetical protein